MKFLSSLFTASSRFSFSFSFSLILANSSPLEPPIDHRHKSEVEIDLRPMSPVSSTYHSYQSPKRRILNSTEENFVKNEKIQALLNELSDSQVNKHCVNLSSLRSFLFFFYPGDDRPAGTTIDEREERTRAIVRDGRSTYERIM